MKKPYEIFLAGTGGQGILTVSDIICDAANNMGLQIRGAETHGMAQRGGSVVAYLRIAKDNVYAPLISERSADVLASFEPVEALRYAKFVKTKGVIITNTSKIIPSFVTISNKPYPNVEEVLTEVKGYTEKVISFDATETAQKLGAAIAQNVVILGALSAVEGFPIPEEELMKSLKSTVKQKFVDLNVNAFIEGRKKAEELLK